MVKIMNSAVIHFIQGSHSVGASIRNSGMSRKTTKKTAMHESSHDESLSRLERNLRKKFEVANGSKGIFSSVR